MYNASLQIQDREVHKFLATMRGALGERNIKSIIGRAGVNRLRSHLFNKDATGAHSGGGRRTHFYAAAARATNYQAVPAGVLLSINHTGIAQRRYGGTIKPVSGRFLTIPAIPQAYGKRAAEFNNLALVIFGSSGVGALVERSHTEIALTGKGVKRGQTRQGKTRRVFFWLVQSVTQQPDPSVLPADADVMGDVMSAVQGYIRRIREQKHGA